jgi:hypothetical protein
MSETYEELGMALLRAVEPSLSVAVNGSGMRSLAPTPAPAAPPPPPPAPAVPPPPTITATDAGDYDIAEERQALAALSTKLEIVSIQARIAQLAGR